MREAQYALADHEQPGYLVMSYDSFVRDWAKFFPLGRSFLVLDEATAIKSFASKRSKHIKKVCNQFEVRFALTGTPVENGKLEEIFSIMEFVDHDVLGKWYSFEPKFITRNHMGWIEGYKNIDTFRKTIKPFLLRATHKDPEVSKYLPKVLHRDPIMVGLPLAARKVVSRISDDILADLDKLAETIASRPLSEYEKSHPDGKMMAKIQALRMFLDHPMTAANSGHRSATDSSGGSAYVLELMYEGVLTGTEGSPKLAALRDYLADHLDDPANKAVVFTSFVDTAERIQNMLPHGAAVLFTGNMSPRQKDAAKQRFASDPKCRVFVSTDAGGYGLDLPQANLLVNYDLPWSAGTLKQRNARIRRASSDWDYVVVQDIIVADTVEERMLAMLSHKDAVADALVDGEGITSDGKVASELVSLRKFLESLLIRS
jgi:SNF2 family DNA or RNA helicase